MSEQFLPADTEFVGGTELEDEQTDRAEADQADAADAVAFDADDSYETDASEEVGGFATPSVTEPEWEPTGDPRVDDAVARLADLPGLPVDEHVAVFDEVARRLHDALAGITPDS